MLCLVTDFPLETYHAKLLTLSQIFFLIPFPLPLYFFYPLCANTKCILLCATQRSRIEQSTPQHNQGRQTEP